MKWFLLLPLFWGSSVVMAGNPTCSGKVTTVGLSSTGYLTATIRRGGTNLADVNFCSLDSRSGQRFSTTVCKSMQSLLMAAKSTNDNVTLWFFESDFTSCSQSWAHLKEQGFYYIRATSN